MKKYFLNRAAAIVPIFLLMLMILPFELLSQHRHDHHYADSHHLFQRIEAAVENGYISRDESILQKFYAGFSPDLLDERFKVEQFSPIKCLTPVIIEFENSRDHMNPAIVQKIDQMIQFQDSQGQETYLSESGNFLIRFSRTGQHAVPVEDLNESGIPDYVERTAFAADSSYRYMVETLGFRDFIKDNPYDISFRNFSSLYGQTIPSGSTTRIEVRNNFIDFAPNLHPEGDEIGALYVTLAHELKHASQYEINRFQGDTGSFDWVEMDATLMEHIVFEDVRDYYNYIMNFDDLKNDWDRNNPSNLSIFGNPGNRTPGAYNHVTWMIYYYEQFGAQFWVDVWNEIDQAIQNNGTQSINFLTAMDRVLSRLNTTVNAEHLRNHMWHMSSGPNYTGYDYGFEDRINYPVASKSEMQLLTDEQIVIQSGLPLLPFAARYHDLAPSSIALGQPSFILDSDINGVYLGIVGYFQDGSVKTLLSQDPNSSIQTIQTTWSWPELVDLNVAVVNTSETQPSGYTLEVISAIPETDLITQNYPNPFNPVTRIDFALNETKDVQLAVYDILGRKVATLIDDRLNQGFHSVVFDGSGLSSGVYIYRIMTDQTVVSKKMLLVK